MQSDRQSEIGTKTPPTCPSLCRRPRPRTLLPQLSPPLPSWVSWESHHNNVRKESDKPGASNDCSEFLIKKLSVNTLGRAYRSILTLLVDLALLRIRRVGIVGVAAHLSVALRVHDPAGLLPVLALAVAIRGLVTDRGE